MAPGALACVDYRPAEIQGFKKAERLAPLGRLVWIPGREIHRAASTLLSTLGLCRQECRHGTLKRTPQLLHPMARGKLGLELNPRVVRLHFADGRRVEMSDET